MSEVQHQSQPVERHAPIRTCVGCRVTAPQAELVRLVLDPASGVVPDLAAKSFGRGAWIHPRPQCLAKASHGLRRSFKQNVRLEPETLHLELCAAARRRALALIAAAQRAGKLAIGRAPVAKVLESGRACIVVCANDARAAVQIHGLPAAVASGLAVAFGSKDEIGSAVGRQEAGIVAVTDAGLARAISRAVTISQMPLPRVERNRERERKDQRVDD